MVISYGAKMSGELDSKKDSQQIKFERSKGNSKVKHVFLTKTEHKLQINEVSLLIQGTNQ